MGGIIKTIMHGLQFTASDLEFIASREWLPQKNVSDTFLQFPLF